MGRELAARTVGLLGLGHIGTRVATLLKTLLKAFGCRVLAVDPFLDAATCAARNAAKVELPELLAECDVVSVHAPLTRLTRGLFGAEAFAAMRQGAIFVTTARGGIHDEAALLAGLALGPDRGSRGRRLGRRAAGRRASVVVAPERHREPASRGRDT